MSRLPDNFPALLRRAGLDVVVVDGWEDRGRPASSGGHDPVGSLNHHTGASAKGWTRAKELAYAKWMFLVGRAPSLPAPLCHGGLGRSGTVYLGAAGRTNHAGTAAASGSVVSGDGNFLYLGWEWMLSGTEEIPEEMYEAGVTLNAVVCEHVTGNSVNTVSCHYNTSVTGKWDIGDPNGVSFRGARVLDIEKFRRDVAARRKELYGTKPVEEPHRYTRMRRRGKVLAKGPSDHRPFVKDFWFSDAKDSRFRAAFWNVHHGTTAAQAKPIFAEIKRMGTDLIILNEVKRKSGIIALLKAMGYMTAYNGPEFAIAWRPGAFDYIRDRDLVVSEHDYWLDRNEALFVALRHVATGQLLWAISEHTPAHISRRNHPTFNNVLEVHKEVSERNAKISARAKRKGASVLIGRDGNIDPRKDRPVWNGTWDWVYEGYRYVRSPKPTFGAKRHIDEMLVVNLRTRRRG